jgi:hypothetical protein
MAAIMGAREFETNTVDDLPNEALRLGPDHYPTGHRDSCGFMREAILATGLAIDSEQHVVDGIRTMGVAAGGNYGDITIPGANVFSMFCVSSPEIGQDYLIGYRNSVAQALAAQACLGKHFPVCTNVSLFGEDIIFRRKNTKNADLQTLMMREVSDRVVPMLRTVQEQLDRLAQFPMEIAHQKADAFDMFSRKVIPAKFMADFDGLIQDCSEAPEIHENEFNALGQMHRATRVIRELPVRRQAAVSQAISRHCGFGC